MATLTTRQYGKTRVRLLRVFRDTQCHDLLDCSVEVLLEGDKFERSYTHGENDLVVATDSIRNTIYVIAKRNPSKTIEEFATTVAKHFVNQYDWVEGARVKVQERVWNRMTIDGAAHNHAFTRGADVKHNTFVHFTRSRGVEVESGLEDLVVLKTTQSGFENFFRDEYRTLPDVKDRILSTSVKSSWKFDANSTPNYNAVRKGVVEAFMKEFAGPADVGHYSPSVQLTLYNTGAKVVGAFPTVKEISFSLPNLHNWAVDMKYIGLENTNEVYYPTDGWPSGLIEATIARKTAAKL